MKRTIEAGVNSAGRQSLAHHEHLPVNGAVSSPQRPRCPFRVAGIPRCGRALP